MLHQLRIDTIAARYFVQSALQSSSYDLYSVLLAPECQLACPEPPRYETYTQTFYTILLIT